MVCVLCTRPVLLALVCGSFHTILNFHKRLAHRNGDKRGKTGVPIIVVCITLLQSLLIKKLYMCSVNFKIQHLYVWQKTHTVLSPDCSTHRPCCKIFSIQHIPRTQGKKYHCTYVSVDVHVYIQSCFSLLCCVLYQHPATTMTEWCLLRLANGTPYCKWKKKIFLNQHFS